MIQVAITAELPEDEFGPRDLYTHQFVLPTDFAEDAEYAHAKLLRLFSENEYVDLPEHGAYGPVPFNTFTVTAIAVW